MQRQGSTLFSVCKRRLSRCDVAVTTIIALGSEYLPRPSASGNIPTLGAIFIDIPRGRVEYL